MFASLDTTLRVPLPALFLAGDDDDGGGGGAAELTFVFDVLTAPGWSVAAALARARVDRDVTVPFRCFEC